MSDLVHNIWASLPVPALILDAEDRIVLVNGQGEQFLNSSSRSLTGQPVFDVLAIDTALEQALRRVRDADAALYINNVDISGGNAPPVESNMQIARLADRDDHLLLLIEPKQLADRIGKSQAVKSTARSAIGMAEMLAHEIKNPLAGITGAAQLLSMNLGHEDQELTDLIVQEARRVATLLEQVEHFGNRLPPQQMPTNIHDLLGRAQKAAALGFAAKMTIIEDYDPSLPMAFVDGDQMIQVFQNLLRNAAEAATDGQGTIKIRTYFDQALRLRRKDGTGEPLPLQIEIIDDGKGLPPDLADDIFEPFVSGREAGTGLGLALVSKIVSDHNGWISVDSVPGRTVFRISLPIARATNEKVD